MTATWYELVSDSRPAEGSGLFGSAFARGGTTRTFIVSEYPRDQIIANPTSILGGATGTEPLPGYNSGHPSLPGLLLGRYSTAPDGIHTRATAYYDNTGRWRIPARIDRTNPAHYELTGSIAPDLTIDIPFGVKITKDVSNGENTITIRVWEERTIRVECTQETISVRVTVNDLSPAHRAAFTLQSGRLHKLDDGSQVTPAWYRFLGATYRESERGAWAVEYSWANDPGTLELPYQSVPGQIAIPPNFTYFDDSQWVRPPHHVVKYVPNVLGALFAPTFAVFLPYVRDDLGWQTLPGL